VELSLVLKVTFAGGIGGAEVLSASPEPLPEVAVFAVSNDSELSIESMVERHKSGSGRSSRSSGGTGLDEDISTSSSLLSTNPALIRSFCNSSCPFI
jgi:hypothetical protein